MRERPWAGAASQSSRSSSISWAVLVVAAAKVEARVHGPSLLSGREGPVLKMEVPPVVPFGRVVARGEPRSSEGIPLASLWELPGLPRQGGSTGSMEKSWMRSRWMRIGYASRLTGPDRLGSSQRFSRNLPWKPAEA